MSHTLCVPRRTCIPLFTVLAGLLLWGCGVNNIPTYDESAKAKWSDAQNALTGALGRLLVTVERYPDLKSNQNFLTLQSQLEGTENRISVARRDYIDSVRAYNTELKTFPGVVWASTLYRSYKPMETFTVAEDVTKPPMVKF